MKVLIYGGGAIGCHLAYCLYSTKNQISIIARGDHLSKIKENGINLSIFDNNILINEMNLKENSNIKFYPNVDNLEDKNFDYIFITVKLKDYTYNEINKINSLINPDTAIIPPCTGLPDWWFNNFFFKKKKKKFNEIKNNFFVIKNIENVIGMSMWLSSVIIEPGTVHVKHIQRGYPLKEINDKMKLKADTLRDFIKQKCISPNVDNIYSEIYGKVINSFAFNLIALDTEFNNYQLKNDSNSINSIKRVMSEFDKIILSLKIPIFQTIEERIMQTLKSTKHTLSMLADYKLNKPVEINYSWKNLALLLSLTNKKANYTQEIYNRVCKKLGKY